MIWKGYEEYGKDIKAVYNMYEGQGLYLDEGMTGFDITALRGILVNLTEKWFKHNIQQ